MPALARGTLGRLNRGSGRRGAVSAVEEGGRHPVAAVRTRRRAGPRVLATLSILTLAGCRRGGTQTDPDLCQHGHELLRGEHYVSLLARVERALPHVARGSRCDWELRLLRVEILVEQRETERARKVLYLEPLAGPPWAELRARYRLCQANLERQDDPAQALRHLDEAMDLARASGSSTLAAEIELRRVSVAVQQRRYDEGLRRLRAILDEAIRRNDVYAQMKASAFIGFVLSEKEFNYEDAIPWHARALELARASGAPQNEAHARLNLGWCYYRLLDFDKAQRFLEEAESGFQLSGNRRDEGTRVGDLADILLDRREYQAASEMYQRALKAAIAAKAPGDEAKWLDDLAEIAIRTGDWNAAERYNSQAAELWGNDSDSKAKSVIQSCRIANGRNDFAKADQCYRSVISAKLRDPIPALLAHEGRAYMLAQTGRTREAEAEYQATKRTLEGQRVGLAEEQDRVNYLSQKIDFYQEYVDFLMGQNRVGRALEIAESSRARALMDKLRIQNVGRAGSAVSFQRSAKASGHVLLSYWVAPDRSYLWAVNGSGVKTYPLPGEARIRDMVKAYDAFIQAHRDPRTTENPAGKQLYDTLIAPAAGMTGKDAKLVIVPDGPLYGLNFETLPAPGPPAHYWIEDVTVSVAPSLDLLEAGRGGQGQLARSLLLIGNPVSPDRAEFPDLKFAAQEMERIRGDLATFRAVMREGRDAEPGAYQRANPAEFGFIHLVAHAVADASEPLESAVILSPGGTGFKPRTRDVLNIPLQAGLVTISACRGAGARVYAGEGLVGFPWAFLQAGARNVIAGLWEVDDRSTADLMGNLYAAIARGADPARALREAKLAAIHSSGAYQKPYYWGPFELFTRQLAAIDTHL